MLLSISTHNSSKNPWSPALFTALMRGLAFELLMPQCVSSLILLTYVFNSAGSKLCTNHVDKDAKSTHSKKSSQILGAMWPDRDWSSFSREEELGAWEQN